MAHNGKNTFWALLLMRREEKPVNIEVLEPIRVEALDLDAQGIARLVPNEEEAAQGHTTISSNPQR